MELVPHDMGSFIDVINVAVIQILHFEIFHSHITVKPVGNVGGKYPLGYRDFPHFENTPVKKKKTHS